MAAITAGNITAVANGVAQSRLSVTTGDSSERLTAELTAAVMAACALQSLAVSNSERQAMILKNGGVIVELKQLVKLLGANSIFGINLSWGSRVAPADIMVSSRCTVLCTMCTHPAGAAPYLNLVYIESR